MDLSSNIKNLRIKNMITQEDLAEFLGVSKSAVSKWERGITCPDISLLIPMSNIFSVTIDEMFLERYTFTNSELKVKYFDFSKSLDVAKDYEEILGVFASINAFKKDYYYDHNLVINMAILNLNYLNKLNKDDKAKLLHSLKMDLNIIINNSTNISHINKAKYLELLIIFLFEDFDQFFKKYEDIDFTLIKFENLLILANNQLGNVEESKFLIQKMLYQYSLQMLSLLAIYYGIEEDKSKVNQISQLFKTVYDNFFIEEVFPYALLEFNSLKIIKSKDLDEIIALAHQTLKVFTQSDFKIVFNDFYYLLDPWVDELDLGTNLSRTKEALIKDFYEILKVNELLVCNQNNKDVKHLFHTIEGMLI